jgi:hypothetical protein
MAKLDPKLLQDFLGFVLDQYKHGEISRTSAVGWIDHLFGALEAPPGTGSDPARYMRVILGREAE